MSYEAIQRYGGKAMLELFSAKSRIANWHRLWHALAKAQKQLGLPIPSEALTQMEHNIGQVDWEKVKEHERRVKHDVMAHLFAFAERCPEAEKILHLGATSTFVTDNGDLMQMHDAFLLLQGKLIFLLQALCSLANAYQNVACLGFTHLQPAQPTTFGKRVCLWLESFYSDLHLIQHTLNDFYFLGLKGATGTQASLLTLFEGDQQKVTQLEHEVSKLMGWQKIIPVSGQTYNRKQDFAFLYVLTQIGVSAHKMGTDLRLLAHMGEVREPLGKEQIGSSAMPYKQNPILSERICGISRYIMSLLNNPCYTAATQWLERTLDDSSNRRLSLADSFIATDSVLNLCCSLIGGLKVNDTMMAQNVKEHLPELLTEETLMKAVLEGESRQQVHENLRRQSRENELKHLDVDPKTLIGLSQKQTHDFVKHVQQELTPLSSLARTPEPIEC